MHRLAELSFALALTLVTFLPWPALSQTTVRAVMQSDLKVMDPIWTGAYITRNHGYMIYDTLLARDAKGDIKPQMLDKYETSADGLTYTFTLRDGLLWHDGPPVTAEDCIASIRRWGSIDGTGQVLMALVESMDTVSDRVFTIRLKQPTALLLRGLSKPSSNVPFMMPKRVAQTPGTTQISEYIGSGPFMLKQDEWKPGSKVVYVKFDKYKPRPEPASGLAGGKRVNVDRVEWIAMPDQQQAVNALLNGEIDYIEQPAHDLLPLIVNNSAIKVVDYNKMGNQFGFRPNHILPPFDNPKIRKALWYALNQEDILQAAIGDPEYYKVCKAMFTCDSTFATEAGMDGLLTSNFSASKALLKEAGYDGTPIVLLHSTDYKVLTNVAPVIKQLLEKGGFKVDMQTMDWQTHVTRRVKKDPISSGGWNAFAITFATPDVSDPLGPYLNSGCDRAISGWPCDERLQQLRNDFARASTEEEQKKIAIEAQKRAIEITAYIHLGQYSQPLAVRQSIDNLVPGLIPVFWEIVKH